MGENQILVAIKKPGELPGLEPLFENSLEAFQKAVGGYIEVVTVASDLVLICNEEGRLLNLPFNTTICGMDFYGPVLAVGTKGEGFASIRGSEVPAILKLLNGRSCR